LVFGLAISGICKLMNFLMNAHWVYSYFQYFDFWNSTFLRSLFFSLVGVEDNRVITVSVRYYIEVFWLCRCTMQIRWFPWPPPKFTEINAESFECSITIPCVDAFLCTQQVIQGMVEQQKGTLLFTGATASMHAGAGFSGLGVVFFLSLVSLPSNELLLFPNFLG
jgi:acyl-CoA thioesterase FadM